MLIDKGHKFEVEYFTQSCAKVFMDGTELKQVKELQIVESAGEVATVTITFYPKDIRVYRRDADEKPAS